MARLTLMRAGKADEGLSSQLGHLAGHLGYANGAGYSVLQWHIPLQ